MKGIESPDLKRVAALVERWPARALALQQQILRHTAEYVHGVVSSRIPAGPTYKAYRKGLQVGVVPGRPANSPVYVVYVEGKKLKERDVDGPKTVLYIRAKRRSRRTPPEIAILETFNPWTPDTLPITPNKRFADIEVKKASRSEVRRVTRLRGADEDKWRRALARVGIRTVKKKTKSEDNLKGASLVSAALRLEFSIGGSGRAHWRPALIDVNKGKAFRAIKARDKDLLLAMTDPKFQRWRLWPSGVRHKVKLRDVQQLVAFQKRLGIRAK